MSRHRVFGKRSSGPPFVQLYHHVLDSGEFCRLSAGARALLLLFARRYNGHNNGNLEMTRNQYRQAGLGSEPTMRKYIAELINGGWIVVTRYGGMRSGPNLYALTYLGIDDTNIEYDPPYKADTLPLHLWKDAKADQRETRRPEKPKSGLHRLRPAGVRSVENTADIIPLPARREAA
jgi:hypothetical protein